MTDMWNKYIKGKKAVKRYGRKIQKGRKTMLKITHDVQKELRDANRKVSRLNN